LPQSFVVWPTVVAVAVAGAIVCQTTWFPCEGADDDARPSAASPAAAYPNGRVAKDESVLTTVTPAELCEEVAAEARGATLRERKVRLRGVTRRTGPESYIYDETPSATRERGATPTVYVMGFRLPAGRLVTIEAYVEGFDVVDGNPTVTLSGCKMLD
jgi:hypothetical protein